MKAELEDNFSAIMGKMRQDLLPEFQGALQDIVGLVPKRMILPKNSTRAGNIPYPDLTLCPGNSSIVSQSQQPMSTRSLQLPQKSPVSPALSSLLSVFGHQILPWQFPVAPTTPVASVLVDIQQLQQSMVGGL